MGYKPGQSGKQIGQPAKNVTNKERETTFTKALRLAICENKFSILLPDGTTFSAVPREKMAEYMAQVMLTGTMRLPTGLEMNFSPREWLETYWNIVNRVDGPPIQSIDQTNRNVMLFDAKGTIFDEQEEKVKDANKVE